MNIGEEGGVVSLEEASLDIPGGSLPMTVLVTLEQNAPDEEVEFDENETPVSDVFTIIHDQDVALCSAGEPFLLVLPFDTTAVGNASPSESEVFVRVVAEDEAFAMLGAIANGQVGVQLSSLPAHASFQVVYNPNCILLLDTDEESPKTLPAPTPWETTNWGVHLDVTAGELRTVVGAILNKDPLAVTRDEAIQVVRDRVISPARDLAVTYQDMGFYQPRLEIRTRDDGSKRYILNIVNTKNNYQPSGGNGFGQVNIVYSTIGFDTSHRLGSCKGIIGHEVFHAVIAGYRINRGPSGDRKAPYEGFNEGMATVMGHTVDHEGGIHVRMDAENRSYTLMLNQPLGIFEPHDALYTNQDFFAYLGKRFGGGTMSYLVGSDMDGDVPNGVLEQTKKHLGNHLELVPGTSSSASYMKAYRRCLHNSFLLQFGSSLADVYWDFARNRAYENNAESCLRPTDTDVQWVLHPERFDAGGRYTHTFLSDTEIKELDYEAVPVLDHIMPFSTRGLLFNGNGFNAKLTLSFETYNWFDDDLGNCMKVKVYRTGYDGTEITAENNTMVLDRFGADFEQVLVLLSNVSTEGPCSIIMTAETQPSETQTRPCAPNGTPEDPWDRWYIQTDDGCDGTWDSEYLYHFEDDGTVSDHWLGVLEGVTWRVEGNKMIITGSFARMEATFSADCQRLENGVSFDSADTFCWKGEMG